MANRKAPSRPRRSKAQVAELRRKLKLQRRAGAEASIRTAVLRVQTAGFVGGPEDPAPAWPGLINRALLSVVRVLIPGVQREKQIHELHVKARGAFTKYLRETPR